MQREHVFEAVGLRHESPQLVQAAGPDSICGQRLKAHQPQSPVKLRPELKTASSVTSLPTNTHKEKQKIKQKISICLRAGIRSTLTCPRRK
jgi:hypothetical protein